MKAITISMIKEMSNNNDLKTQPLCVDDDGEQRMTSLEIAELTGKQHKDVLKAIRNMESGWTQVAGRTFALGSYKDANGQERPCYILSKTECLYISTKFNDEERARLVIRWKQLEEERLEAWTVGTDEAVSAPRVDGESPRVHPRAQRSPQAGVATGVDTARTRIRNGID